MDYPKFNPNIAQVITPDSLLSEEKVREYREYYEKKKGKFKAVQELKFNRKRDQVKYAPQYKKEDQDQGYTTIHRDTVVNIDSSLRDKVKYPKPSHFETKLGREFINVKTIELVSTEFPNTDQVIRQEPVELQNNLIMWQNEEDIDLGYKNSVLFNTNSLLTPHEIDFTIQTHGLGEVGYEFLAVVFNSKLDSSPNITGFIDGENIFFVKDANTISIKYKNGVASQGTASIDLGMPKYSVFIKPGNYSAKTLSTQISHDTGLVKRRNGTGQFHYFTASINLDTDVMKLDSVIVTQLGSNPISTDSGSTTITVTQKGHGFKTGERVKMIGVKSIAGIQPSDINGDFSINVLDFNTFTYEVITRANESVDFGGGTTVKTGKDAPFRLLFDTENTRIQFNTGFPDENSTEYHNQSEDPILTKALAVNNASQVSTDILRFTTTTVHGLEACNTLSISNITAGYEPVVTTTTPHGITKKTVVFFRDTNCVPVVTKEKTVIPYGPTNLIIKNLTLTGSGNSGTLLYGGDRIRLSGIEVFPPLPVDNVFFVENIPSTTQLDIKLFTTNIVQDTLSSTVIGTSQVYYKHPDHGFNFLTTIKNTTVTGKINCSTFSLHPYIGFEVDGVPDADGPVSTNTIDLSIIGHRLTTSDTVNISNSTSLPSIDGEYKIQVVDPDTIRINFVHVSFTPGTSKVKYGGKVSLSFTKSVPKVDGYHYIQNARFIQFITTGTISTTVTTDGNHDWSIGDTVSFYYTDTNPVFSSSDNYVIQAIPALNQFEIVITEPITASGTDGYVVNKSRFKITQASNLTTEVVSGSAGIIGRDHDVIHYRLIPDNPKATHIGGIPLSILNGVQRHIDTIIDKDMYMIRVGDNFATRNVQEGGTGSRVSSQIHGLRSIQVNTDTAEFSGSLYRSIFLDGEEYVFLVSPGLDSVYSNTNIKNIFAKILLSESPGLRIHNSYISAAKEFEDIIPRLETIFFSVVTKEGYLFNFQDIDYSFSLKITEVVTKPKDSGKATRKRN